MITIHCSRACAHLASPPELLTAGMAKAVTVEFVFSDDWSGLTKTAVFSAGRTTVDVLESAWDGNKVVVPHEILADAGPIARVGVYGANADGLILPTVWVTLGKVMPAAEPSGDPGADPTLPIWAQLQEIIGDLADLTTKAKNNLVAAINEAAKTGSGGAGSIDLRTADGYIQYSNDGGATWENLIALADLKGEKGEKGNTGATGPQGKPGERGPQGETGPQGPQGETGPDGAPGKDGSPGKDGAPGADGATFTPSVSASGDLSWTNDGGKGNPETINIKGPQGEPGPTGPQGENGPQGPTGATGPQGPAGKTPVKGTDYFTEADKQEIASAAAGLVDLSGKQDKITTSGILKGDGAGGITAAEAGTDYAAPSLGLTGTAVGQVPAVKTIDEQGKPTEWEPATLAKVDGSNIPSSMQDTFRTNIATLPGVKVYGKADANGKIKAYIDAACTKEASYLTAMGLVDYGNALLIYDHKTYQCVGFEEPASMQGSGAYAVAVFFRSEIATDSAGAAVLKVETAKLNVLDYQSGAINAPITITAGELPLTTTTTT